jgi:anti-sigma factor RsiW
MTCDETRPALLDLHFSTLNGAVRDAVETHLCTCSLCVQEFLALKRACDEGEAAPAPSPGVAVRIQHAARVRLSPPRPRWERPMAVALAAAVTLFAVSMMGELSRVGSWASSSHGAR